MPPKAGEAEEVVSVLETLLWSISKFWFNAVVVIKVPPVMLNVWLSKSTAPVPESPLKSKSCAVICESTYPFEAASVLAL